MVAPPPHPPTVNTPHNTTNNHSRIRMDLTPLHPALTPLGASLAFNALLLVVVVWQMLLRDASPDRRARGWESEMLSLKKAVQRLDSRRGLAKTWSSRLYWGCVLYGVLVSAMIGLVARSPSRVPVVVSYVKAGVGAVLGGPDGAVGHGPSLSAAALALASAALIAPAAAFWLGRGALDRYVRHLAGARKQLNKERAAALQRLKDELPFKVALPLLQKYDVSGVWRGGAKWGGVAKTGAEDGGRTKEREEQGLQCKRAGGSYGIHGPRRCVCPTLLDPRLTENIARINHQPHPHPSPPATTQDTASSGARPLPHRTARRG